MQEYYIVIKEKKQGPFSIEELKKQKITSTTLVWYKDLDDWTEAKNIDELKPFVKAAPPPIPKKNDTVYKIEAQISKKKKKFIKPSTNIEITKIIVKTSKIIKKEIIANLIIFFSAIIIYLILAFVFFINDQGYAHYKMYKKWDNYYKNGFNNTTIRNNYMRQSNDLGWSMAQQDRYYGVLNYHKYQYEKIKTKAINRSADLLGILIISLIVIRYIYIIIDWINKASKKYK